MAAFGDVLRGMGSVLNPQVEKELGAADAQQQDLAGKVGLMQLQQQIQQASPQYQMQQEALQNERDFRKSVAGANGDKAKIVQAAMQYGKPELAASIYKAEEDRAARIEQAQSANEMRALQLTQMHEQKMQGLQSAAERNAEIARHNRALEGISAQNAGLNAEIKRSALELQKLKLEGIQDKQLQTQVQQLGKAVEGAKLNETNLVLKNAEDQIAKNPQILEYATGLKSAAPDFSVPAEVAQGRQAISKVFNIDLKNRSGSAVTNQELERLKDEYGRGLFKTPAQLKGALEKARDIVNSHYKSVAAGFGPDVLKAYNENLGGIGGMPVIEPKESQTLKFDAQGNPIK